jgi:hypothetical protein
MMPFENKTDRYIDEWGNVPGALLASWGGSAQGGFGAQALVALSHILQLVHKSRRMAAREGLRRVSLVERVRMFLARHRRYREVQRRLGVELTVPYEKIDDLLVEVERHRWIEAEKAGRDIWSEQNPADPEGLALRHWFRAHFSKWHRHHVQGLTSLFPA